MIHITAAVVHWVLVIGYNGAPSYDMSAMDSFATKRECHAKVKEVMADHPQYITAKCERACKGKNRECDEARQKYMEDNYGGER